MAILVVQMLEGIGGRMPVETLIGLLVPSELPQSAADLIVKRGDFLVKPDLSFINIADVPLTVPGFHIPGVDGDSQLQLDEVVEGKLSNISSEGFEVEFSEEHGIVGSTIKDGKQVGKGRHLGFKLNRQKLLIRTKAIEPVFVRGMKIEMGVKVE